MGLLYTMLSDTVCYTRLGSGNGTPVHCILSDTMFKTFREWYVDSCILELLSDTVCY